MRTKETNNWRRNYGRKLNWWTKLKWAENDEILVWINFSPSSLQDSLHRHNIFGAKWTHERQIVTRGEHAYNKKRVRCRLRTLFSHCTYFKSYCEWCNGLFQHNERTYTKITRNMKIYVSVWHTSACNEDFWHLMIIKIVLWLTLKSGWYLPLR